ncbi:hypothetical protein Scep_022458 [Stephania cephalantha]|uniref:Uncharacterized protein n=1 Tax=Stephania cephalantha TaxID=152367 RepID=A0AAP0I2P9_9MAGN
MLQEVRLQDTTGLIFDYTPTKRSFLLQQQNLSLKTRKNFLISKFFSIFSNEVTTPIYRPKDTSFEQ